MKTLFATTSRGFEELLKQELTALGAKDCRLSQGGVHFRADDETQYRTMLWSRLASRILLPLIEGKIYSDVDLYALITSFHWETVFDERSTFFVNFNGTNRDIRHSQFGAMRVKDGIVDYFERHGKNRPNVDKSSPDIHIHVYLNRENVVISLDLSGEALHSRGWREETGKAPLKETLAAAVIMRSGWKKGTPLLDPMCGSGTLLIEAAQMEVNIAPQLYRTRWGFDFWLGHNQAVWEKVKNEALEQVQKKPKNTPHFFGFDLDPYVLRKAKRNAQNAGVSDMIVWKQGDVGKLQNPITEKGKTEKGTIVCNPPYGERLGTTPALIGLYTVFGHRLKNRFGGWNVSVFSGDPALLDCLRLRSSRQFKAKNGPLDCVQKNYFISESALENKDEIVNNESVSDKKHTLTTPFSVALDFANRLQKNIKKTEKWAKQEGLEAYRLYDADLPEYNIAVDRYGDHIVVQEYAAPKNIDEQKVRQRLLDALTAVLQVTGVSADKLVLKVRQKQKGTNQYEKLADRGEYFFIHEYGVKLWVNLTDYLDTGLFLDHRLTRKMLREKAKGKDFLNLFAYTGSASVYAALGGAKSTTTVDMSNTYLNWAEQNFELNEIKGDNHHFIQADCLQWLTYCQQTFDLIFVDPPTFSNSKRMQTSWDVQRDHLELLAQLKRILRLDGILIFSNNKRGFKMNEAGLKALGLVAQEISSATLPFDFERNKRIHNCWLIRHFS